MTYVSPFGKLDGLADRMNGWVERMSHDKTLPWVGLGIIADTKLAAETISGVEGVLERFGAKVPGEPIDIVAMLELLLPPS